LRIVVLVAVLANLILTVALITQVRDVQQRVTSLPADPATRRDVAALRPLPIRQILRQNCVECHSTRRLAVTLSMEPTEIQSTVERMQSHPVNSTGSPRRCWWCGARAATTRKRSG
jgi:hypothetical protein